jgi:hypothetical protein
MYGNILLSENSTEISAPGTYLTLPCQSSVSLCCECVSVSVSVCVCVCVCVLTTFNNERTTILANNKHREELLKLGSFPQKFTY